ncbi:MAG: NAD-dependent epimerase/dehydratase family protein [Chloroflexi bacterium]|nr:NAD-dependent epimerase/dehydratase family protein [Chloroflexota bacterium]
MRATQVILGTGAIGRAIMHELRTRGEAVRMVSRSGKMAEAPADVEIVAADLYDANQVRAVCAGAQVVYHTAQPDYHQWPELFPVLQTAILTGLTGSSAKLVLAENCYMYGDTHGAPLSEDVPHQAQTRKGQVRSAISQQAFASHRAGQVRVTSARGSDYFGPWGLTSAAMGERTFIPLIQGKKANLLGNIDVPHTHTYTLDFGRAMVILGTDERADGLAWHVPNDMPTISQREMLTHAAQILNVPVRYSVMGRMLMQMAGLFIPAAKETVEMMYEFEQPFIVNSHRFEATFGMRATPMHDALATTIAWYQQHLGIHRMTV